MAQETEYAAVPAFQFEPHHCPTPTPLPRCSHTLRLTPLLLLLLLLLRVQLLSLLFGRSLLAQKLLGRVQLLDQALVQGLGCDKSKPGKGDSTQGAVFGACPVS